MSHSKEPAVSDTVTFYTNPMSRGQIVHWMLEEARAPYEMKILDFEKREHKSPEYLAINPMGKVPAIVHRGVVVTECAAICAYLADAFPDAGLAPDRNDPARGTYYRWLFFAAGCVEPAVIDKVFQRPPITQTGAVGWGTYEDTLNTLESALQRGRRVYRRAARLGHEDEIARAAPGLRGVCGALRGSARVRTHSSGDGVALVSTSFADR
jgi:glutathione S-transferase